MNPFLTITKHFPIHSSSSSALKTKQLPSSDGITKQFLPILSLLQIFGLHPLTFTQFEDHTGSVVRRTTKRTKVNYSMDFKSKAFINSISFGLVLNVLQVIFLLEKDVLKSELIPHWMYECGGGTS
jgi:hypothetical protein